MSMLSAQIDKLRKAAQTYRTLGGHEMEHTLLDAADTIDGLRTRCQDVQAENEKLRHENETLRADAAHWELGNCPSCPNVADLQKALDENARLRELCAGLWLKLDIATQYDAGGVRGVVYEFADFMRELGLEVGQVDG